MTLRPVTAVAMLAGALCALAPLRSARAETGSGIQLVPSELAELRLPARQGRHKRRRKRKHEASSQQAQPAPTVPAPDLSAGAPAQTAAPPPESPPASPGLSDVPPAASSEPALTPDGSNAQGGDDLNFNLLGNAQAPQKTAAEERVEGQAAVRRTVLTIHQTAGLVTLAALTATVIVGQLSYSDKFGTPPDNTGRWEEAHEILSFTTVAGFTTTGLLGLFAPKPYDRPVEADTTLAHKILMGVATLGMVAELGLGVYTASHEGLANQKSLAQAHQVIGYTTLAAMGAGASAFLF